MSLANSRRGGKTSADRSRAGSKAPAARVPGAGAPRAKRASVGKTSSAKRAAAAKGAPLAPLKSVKCRTCGSRIRIPDGWTPGPAVRKHYWAKHRDVMLPDRKGSR